MKKVACAVVILTMVIFLISPLSSDARGGYGGGHWGGGWWVPWAVLGGAAVLAPYFYAPPPVIIQEQPPVYFQPAPSVTPPSTERIFVYPRQGQSEELQAKDRYECHSWAVSQTWREPRKVSMEEWTFIIKSMPEAQRNQMRTDYHRALDACLDGRGYTMR
jgi:hypothetical protein